MRDALTAFLLGFPALLSIASPLAVAFIFASLTIAYSPKQRERVARLVAVYTLVIALVAVWTGSFVLGFFGISLSAVRVAGGLLIAISGWDMLRTTSAPDLDGQSAPDTDPDPGNDGSDIALVPLTMPLTAGPGMISVAVALGSEHPPYNDPSHGELAFFVGLTLAAIAVAVSIWLIYRSADQITRRLSPTGFRTLNRLFGFLLLCIGVQVLISGVVGVLGDLLIRR